MQIRTKLNQTILMAAMGVLLGMGTICAAADTPAPAPAAQPAEPAELDGDTVSYDMKSGVVTAEGDVLMVRGTTKIAGARAEYNSKTQQGSVTGNVVAIKDAMRMTAQTVVMDQKDHITASGGVTATKGNLQMQAAQVVAEGQNHFIATGDVHGQQEDKTFAGPKVDFHQDTNYVLIESGGTITSKDGVFTADHMEGWLTDNHFKGIGNAHIVSPPRNFEGGGDVADYYGQADGKVTLDGNAWAVQENNTLKGNHLTVYLENNGSVKAE